MGDIQVENTIARLNDSKASVRKETLEELKRILQKSRELPEFPVLHDDGFHEIFEALFQAIRQERALYVSSARSSKSSATVNRLREYAAVFRLTVELGVSRLQSKTAISVLDHVVETLPLAQGAFCEPLADDYTRILRTILGRAAHVEHLRDRKWCKLVDFLIIGLSHYTLTDENVAESIGSIPSQNSWNDRIPSFKASQASDRYRSGQDVSKTVDDLLVCISCLAASPNAPLMTKAISIYDFLIRLLYSHPTSTSLFHIAFECINTVLKRAITEDSRLAKRIVLGVLPILRKLWSSKHTSLRDEMLITLILGRDIIKNLSQSQPQDETRTVLCNLFEAIAVEYNRRNERDILQLDDILLQEKSGQAAMSLAGMQVRPEHTRATFNWAIISILGSIALTVEGFPLLYDETRSMQTSGKRSKLTGGVDDIRRLSLGSVLSNKVQALQTIPFLLEERPSVSDRFSTHIAQYTEQLLDEEPLIASWTMIALASLVMVEPCTTPHAQSPWLQVWHFASRNLSNPGVSRSAAHLLNCLLNSRLLSDVDISKLIEESLFSNGINGPVGMSDAALSLWLTIIKQHFVTGPTMRNQMVVRFLNWLTSHYVLTPSLDRTSLQQLALYATGPRLLEILLHCAGLPIKFHWTRNIPAASPAFLAAFEQQCSAGPAQYLLQGDIPADNLKFAPKLSPSNENTDQAARHSNKDKFIIELILAKMQTFKEAWLVSVKERASNATPDLVQVVTSLILVGSFLPRLLGSKEEKYCLDLSQATTQFWDAVLSFLQRSDVTEAAEAAFTAAATMARVSLAEPVGTRVGLPIMAPMADALYTLLARTTGKLQAWEGVNAGYFGKEGPLNSRDAKVAVKSTSPLITRQNVPFCISWTELKYEVQLQLLLLSDRNQEKPLSTGLEPPLLIEHLLRLGSEELLAAHTAVLSCLKWAKFSRPELAGLLKKIAEVCIQDYEFERCEASLCFCLAILEILAEPWTSTEDDELHDVALDVYGWFVNVILRKRLASAGVLASMARLLRKVVLLEPISPNRTLPSGRTSLLDILGDGSNAVRFQIAEYIASIFDRFILTEHTAILEDVVDKLPNDPADLDGIALRLYLLTKLAARSEALLYPSVYRIFETTAHIPSCATHALNCLTTISTAASLASPRQLFVLFAPQLLYDWLDEHTLDTVPYGAFGFPNLNALVGDVLSELLGQGNMRRNTKLMDTVSHMMQKPFATMVETSFSKVEAYSIARDISLPPSKGDSSKSTESHVRKLVGKEKYLRLLSTSFSDIVSVLFAVVCNEDDIKRALSRRPQFAQAYRDFNMMCEFGSSNIAMPHSTQPSFRAKYLIDQLDFLCQRVGIELMSMWTPVLVTYVCRRLLDSMVPALGLLYASATLRKIRIIVALAGRIAQQGYALEMLLQALQPYLVRHYCTEDAAGVFRFLLERGREHLEQNLPFLFGLALKVFFSISAFLTSPRPLHVQESQHVSATSVSKSLRSWMVEYLDNLDENATTFKTSIDYARKAGSSGCGKKNSPGGHLLLQLLELRCTKSSLLPSMTFKSTMKMLCASFEAPDSWEEDILEDDALAIRYATCLWSVLRDNVVSEDFWIWSAGILGRAYAANGRIDSSLSREHPQDLFCASSRSAILTTLQDLLLSDDSAEVSVAEKALGEMITLLASHRMLDVHQQPLTSSTVQALNWHPASYPSTTISLQTGAMATQRVSSSDESPKTNWSAQFTTKLAQSGKNDPFLGPLPPLLEQAPNLASSLMPFLVHIFLETDTDKGHPRRQVVSDEFHEILTSGNPPISTRRRLVLRTILYLRTQSLLKENTIADRATWVEIDLGEAAAAAVHCAMFKSALLLFELGIDRQSAEATRSSRRWSSQRHPDSGTLLRSIYQGLDDPDFWYGMQNEASLASVIDQLAHEDDNYKSLSFYSALSDSAIKCSEDVDHANLLRALSAANLDSIARAVQARDGQRPCFSNAAGNSHFRTALNLHQWDLPTTSFVLDPGFQLYRVFHVANTLSNVRQILETLDNALLQVIKPIVGGDVIGNELRHAISTLATLTETREGLCCRGMEESERHLLRLQSREPWQKVENFDKISLLLAGREALFSTVKKQKYVSDFMGLGPTDGNILEVRCVRHSLKLARDHNARQPALNRAVFLSNLAKEAGKSRLELGDVALHDLASVLADQGDTTACIQMLKQVKDNPQAHLQSVEVSRPALLADMGRRIADSRSERPKEIIRDYHLPAIKALKGERKGTEAGQVHHEFALFCDQQLRSVEELDAFSRLREIHQQREAEVSELEKMVNNAQGKERQKLAAHHAKAKQWFKLDDAEFQRLKDSRETFLAQTLENYLLALQASEAHSNDVLRFCAIWLDNSSNQGANDIVARYMEEVPSRKFVPLMNQLCSRLLDHKNEFQNCLFNLVLRICQDHPFHGMYQAFASSKSKGGKDDIALARHAAANRLSIELQKGPASNIWIAVHNSNISFIRFALDNSPHEAKYKSGSKIPLAKMRPGAKLVEDIANVTTKIPPPTLRIPIRADCDYSSLPVLDHFDPTFVVAGGVSAPKIITMVASDGGRMKALLKGGNDDLRQDSIMEQVFEQVSNLLKDHRETRQRQLGIRSYKVLPLTMNAGIIEFVLGTVPLHEYSMPAHAKYYPKDWKPNKCRKEIGDVQSRSQQTRIQTLRTVWANFHPVLRHFFFERYLDPDEWFAKRLAYSRSTAAVSILGHVLGLGDRHGHNILLDEKTGEAVHIDLGVAFEAGRVLPVPEVVPFRLTRDIVDGMGISGVEGVFRRCCNFTLAALRQDQYSIMTILDVLRYDPLYSWSISPLRQQRMQEENKKQEEVGAGAIAEAETDANVVATGDVSADVTAAAGVGARKNPNPVTTAAATTKVGLPAAANRRPDDNPGEADRALTVVARKLGKTLSVEATVNELIQQAMDERNLAMLYCGWAAYA